MFTSKIGLPRVVPVLRWVLFGRQIFVSPHSEFEQHTYSSDPSPDIVSFMQLESRRAAPQASQPPSKASGRTFNSTTRRPRSGNPLQTSRSRTLFSFSWFLRADQEAVSRFAAFLLWIKAFALQKRLLSVLFTQAGRTAAILDVAINVMRRKRLRSAKQGNHLKRTETLKPGKKKCSRRLINARACVNKDFVHSSSMELI